MSFQCCVLVSFSQVKCIGAQSVILCMCKQVITYVHVRRIGCIGAQCVILCMCKQDHMLGQMGVPTWWCNDMVELKLLACQRSIWIEWLSWANSSEIHFGSSLIFRGLVVSLVDHRCDWHLLYDKQRRPCLTLMITFNTFHEMINKRWWHTWEQRTE